VSISSQREGPPEGGAVRGEGPKVSKDHHDRLAVEKLLVEPCGGERDRGET
jgi:hypothetical protein